MNCLDSSYIVDFLDPEQTHHAAAVEWMETHGEDALAVPAICAFEVLRGTARAGDNRFDRAVGFLRTLSVLNFGLDAAIAAGNLDGRLHADGAPLGARDTLVASPAREHGYTLVTRDRDFESVPGLDITFYDDP
ncbi:MULTISPECIES: PIN domain-containing protein [Salinibaculum]|uniref:PIN domain-containing protein n=1 Tax=Salinibaculum TaxID=2732368 RepID=UPI0030D549F1